MSTGFKNATLMTTAVHKDKSGHGETPHDIIERYSYDSSNTERIKNACDECSPKSSR